MIDGDAIQPGPERTLISKAAQFGHGLDQDFLRRVLRGLATPDHAQGEIEHPCLVPPHKLIQSIHASGLSMPDPTCVGVEVWIRVEVSHASEEYPRRDYRDASMARTLIFRKDT